LDFKLDEGRDGCGFQGLGEVHHGELINELTIENAGVGFTGEIILWLWCRFVGLAKDGLEGGHEEPAGDECFLGIERKGGDGFKAGVHEHAVGSRRPLAADEVG